MFSRDVTPAILVFQNDGTCDKGGGGWEVKGGREGKGGGKGRAI